MTPFDTLRMTAADFAAVAGCRPTSQALTVLREGQISRRLLMLKSVADMARRTVPGLWSRSGAADGWELCGRARGADAQAFEWVVLAPHVGVWLGRCLRALTRSDPASRLSVDLSRLGSFAAAAALRAGLHPDITLSTPDGLLWLPTLGVAELPEGTQRVRLDGPYLRLAGRTVGLREDQGRRLATEGPRWLSPHRVTVHPDGRGPVLSVAIDDVDPYRLPPMVIPCRSGRTPSKWPIGSRRWGKPGGCSQPSCPSVPTPVPGCAPPWCPCSRIPPDVAAVRRRGRPTVRWRSLPRTIPSAWRRPCSTRPRMSPSPPSPIWSIWRTRTMSRGTAWAGARTPAPSGQY